MVFHPEVRPVHTIGPDGTRVDGSTVLNANTCCVVWAWSESSQCWMRQTDFVPYSHAAKAVGAITAECPNVRPVLTPARYA